MTLKDYLRALDWSQGDLARAIEVDPDTVSRWATGKSPLPGYARAYLELRVKVRSAIAGLL